MNITRTALLMMIWLFCQPVAAAAFNIVQPLKMMPQMEMMPSGSTCHEMMSGSMTETGSVHHASPCSMDDSQACCDIQCHCLAGGCTFFLSSNILAEVSDSFRILNMFHVFALAQTSLSYPYRPPISV